MKMLLISDIHGNWPALQAELAAEPDADQILCLGDLVNYGPQPAECARAEIVDLLHFVISLAQVMEMTPDELFEAYTKKHVVSLSRQDSGCPVKEQGDNKPI